MAPHQPRSSHEFGQKLGFLVDLGISVPDPSREARVIMAYPRLQTALTRQQQKWDRYGME